MPHEKAPASWQRVGSIATIFLLVAGLYLGKPVFVPFALAMLLAFLLAPVVHRLERLHLPRTLAAVVTMLLASTGIVGVGWVVYGQLDELANSIPRYRDNIQGKLKMLGGSGPVGRIQEGLSDVGPPVEEPTPADSPTGEPRARVPSSPPVAVTVVPTARTPVQAFAEILGPLLAPLGTIGVVLVLVLFILIYREDLRNRLIRLVSRGELIRTTQAISDVSDRISRYLLMTLIVNATYGIPIGIGLWILGVPNALLWGLFAILLRFIPYVGPWIAAAFPILLSFAISPGWELTAWVVGLFVVLELISNNLVEPRLYGKKTGLSPVAVVVAAVFWTWLWGTIGLLLAIPLTLILAVVGRYVPQLKFLSILLRDEPGLGPDERFYQRLVAGDSEEASTVAEEYLEDHSAQDFYDDVVLPALRSTKRDALLGRLDAASLRFVRESTQTLVEEISERQADAKAVPAASDAAVEAKQGDGAEAEAPPPDSAPAVRFAGVRLMFISAGDDTDSLAGPMLADVLRPDGIEVEVLAGMSLTSELTEAVRQGAPDVVCVGGIPPYVTLRARHLCKRLRSQASGVRVVLGMWDAKADPEWTETRVKIACADRVVPSIAAAAEAVRALASESIGSPGGVLRRPEP